MSKALIKNYKESFSRKDIAGHLNALLLYGSSVSTIVELGAGSGASTSAFVLAKPYRFRTYDVSEHPRVRKIIEDAKLAGVDAEYIIQDSLEVEIEGLVDLLFIDTWHTFKQLDAELQRHGDSVDKYIIMHDTTAFGVDGEKGGEGLIRAIGKFLKVNSHWIIHEHTPRCNGLTILRRSE